MQYRIAVVEGVCLDRYVLSLLWNKGTDSAFVMPGGNEFREFELERVCQ